MCVLITLHWRLNAEQHIDLTALGHDQAQSIIDQITSAYETGGPPPGGFGFGPQHLGGPPPGYGGPPMGFGGPMPPPGFGGRTCDHLSYPEFPLTIPFLPSATSLPPWSRISSDDASGRSPFPSKWHGTSRRVSERYVLSLMFEKTAVENATLGPPPFPPGGGPPVGIPPFPPGGLGGPPPLGFNAPPPPSQGGPPDSDPNGPPAQGVPPTIHPDRLRMMAGAR